ILIFKTRSFFVKEGSPNKIRELNDSIVYNIGKVYVFLNQYLSDIYREFSLNPAKFNLLMVIKHVGAEEGISQNNLKEQLCVSAANITKLIDGLQDKGLIIRIASKTDRRVNLIKITENGQKLIEAVWPRHVGALNALLKDYNYDDRCSFNHYISKFIDEMRLITGNHE
ncbi:MAG: MarR family transcriptional regulator, partial [Candidatus Omnitrophica bacterium]|nr:MarR family transcriptional regulator [Candidatus Omnitrophota bacterium]